MATVLYCVPTAPDPAMPALTWQGPFSGGSTVLESLDPVLSGTGGGSGSSIGTSTADRHTCMKTFVSDPLTSGGTLGGTAVRRIRARETDSAFNAYYEEFIYVTVGSTTAVRGVLSPATESGTEMPTAYTLHNATLTLNPVVVQAGDRIVIEVGAHLVNPTHTASGNIYIYRGGITDDASWYEFSNLAGLDVVPLGPEPVSESGTIAAVVSDIYSNRTNSSGDESYDVPTTAQAATMAGAFGKLMTGDFTGAAVDVDPYGYDVVLFTDTGNSRQYAFLRERTTATRFWGFYAWSREAGRTAMVIEAPHPKFDLNTHTEAGSLFTKSNAKGFLLATTHRNANAATEADGDRVTDVANYGGDNVFQDVHETVAVAGSTVVQIHGFADATEPSYDIVVSEGQPTPSARTLKLADDLRASPGAFRVGVYDGTVGAALGATGNVQGQQSRPLGVYWVHIEQNTTLRGSATSRGYVEDVLALGIPEPTAPAPGQLFDLSRWHITLPTEDPGPDTDAAQIDQPELATFQDANNYTENGQIVCRAPVQGFTTSGASGATRTEYREHEAGSYANSAWDPLTTGRRQLTITTHVDASNIAGGTTPRKEAICFQIHGAGSSPIPLNLTAEYHVATPRIRVFLNGPGFDNPVLGITPTTPITVRCRVEDARVKLWVIAGQVTDLPATPTYDWPVSGTFTDLTGWYFKWGIYNKTVITSGSTGESYARISYYELLQPGDPDPVPLVSSGRMLLALP